MKTMMVADILPAEPILKALGQLTVRHTQLDYQLRLLLKSVGGATLKDALLATQNEMSSQLRRRILKLARRRFLDGLTVIRIQSWLSQANDFSKSRNRFLHCYWAGTMAEPQETVRMLDGLKWSSPAAEEIIAVAEKMQALTAEMDHERLYGWLKAAIDATKPVP